MPEYLKVEVYLPEEFVSPLRDALDREGFLREGHYAGVMALLNVTGTWIPLEGASPYDGEIGKLSNAAEIKAEFRCRSADRERVEAIIRSVHPYEVQVINFIPLAD